MRAGSKQTSESDNARALALLSATLDKLRDDASQSREMQQRVVQWYGTVLGSVIFGGLVYSTANQGKTVDPVVVVTLYGLVGPAIALIANIVYLGELKRLGRVAAVWRSLERLVAETPSLQIPVRSGRLPSLFIESAYADMGRDRLTRGYGSAAYYVAYLALFLGGWVLSLIIGFALTRAHPWTVTLFSQQFQLLLICSGCAALIWILSTLRLSMTIRTLSGQVAPISTENPQ